MSITFPVGSRMTEEPLLVHTGGFTFTNGYLLRGPGGAVAVDAPQGMADWLGSLQIRLKALILTHCHFDHVVDAANLAREHGCEIFAFGPSTPETRLELHLKKWAGISFSVEEYPVHVSLKGVQVVQIAGRSFTLAHVPGHSPDSLVFTEEGEGRVFTGDTLMKGGIGRSDFPDGDGPLLLKGIQEKILTLPPALQVFSGHGPATTIATEIQENPFLL